MRLILMAALLAGCEGGISEPLHEVEECVDQPLFEGQCERACSDEALLEPAADPMCTPRTAEGEPASCAVAPIEVFMGTRGCCVPNDGVLRFFVCEEQ